MLDIQFDKSTTTIKTSDITYEGYGTKSSDLCGILGFVDDQGHIHLSSNFDLYTMRPKLTDFNLISEQNMNNEDNKLEKTDLDEKFGTEQKRRSVHSKKRNTIETNALKTAVSSAREQVLNTSNENIINNIISLDDDDEQMVIPKLNYDAKKPEDVFIFDDSLYFFFFINRIYFSINSY